MPKHNLTARYAQEKPSSTVQHKRRTEAEMRKALAVVESKKELLHIHADDDHDVVLHDTVTELLALRQVVTKLMQQLEAAQQEATTAMKNVSPLQG